MFMLLSLFQVHYEDDATLQQLFSYSNLHLAVVFPGLSGASDIEPLPLTVGVAQKAFLNFGFVLADRLACISCVLCSFKQLSLITAGLETVTMAQDYS